MSQIESNNSSKIILSLYDYTGNWSRPYREAGYDVRQVDWKTGGCAILYPSMVSRDPRLPSEFEDVSKLRNNGGGGIYGILAAPPCTVFSGSGACRRRTDDEIRAGLSMVDAVLRIVYASNPKFWCMENPVGKLRKWIGPPTMYFQPYEFGDPYTKKTCLWGNFNTDLKRTPVKPIKSCAQGSWLQKLGGKSERTKELRSATPEGFAKAFFEANQ